MSRAETVLICIIAAYITLMVQARPANSHGEASWIMANPQTAYCCGPHDCDRVPKSAVKITAGGFLVDIAPGVMAPVIIAYGKELPSKDDDYWACLMPDGIRCFFAPPMGV